MVCSSFHLKHFDSQSVEAGCEFRYKNYIDTALLINARQVRKGRAGDGQAEMRAAANPIGGGLRIMPGMQVRLIAQFQLRWLESVSQ